MLNAALEVEPLKLPVEYPSKMSSLGQARYTGDTTTWAEREIGICPHFLIMHRILTRPKPIESAEYPLSIGFGLVKIRCILRKLGWIPSSLTTQVFVFPVYYFPPPHRNPNPLVKIALVVFAVCPSVVYYTGDINREGN